MKIALIHSHLNDRGGSQRYVIEIANSLLELGIYVDIFCYEYNKLSCYPELTSKLDIKKIYTREKNICSKNLFKNENKFKKLLRMISKNNFLNKIIISLGVDYLYSLYSTNNLAKKVSKMMLHSDNEYDLIFAHEEPLSVYAAIKYKKIKNIPLYWFCYDTVEKWFLEWKDEHKASSIRKFLLQNIYFIYDKYIINKFVDSSAVLDNQMLKRYQKIYSKTPIIRRGGIPKSIFQKPKNIKYNNYFNISNDKVVIFSLTRFVKYRRVHDIFEMYRKLDVSIKQNVLLYLNSPITDESYYNWCKLNYKEIFECENVKISLEYPKNDDEMFKMYLSSDIFIFPNENQTWGHAPIEAMACGVATFVSSGCGISEVIKDINTDAVFQVGNVKELCAKIENIINRKLYKKLSQLQKSYVHQNLTWDNICKTYIKDFNQLIDPK